MLPPVRPHVVRPRPARRTAEAEAQRGNRQGAGKARHAAAGAPAAVARCEDRSHAEAAHVGEVHGRTVESARHGAKLAAIRRMSRATGEPEARERACDDSNVGMSGLVGTIHSRRRLTQGGHRLARTLDSASTLPFVWGEDARWRRQDLQQRRPTSARRSFAHMRTD